MAELSVVIPQEVDPNAQSSPSHSVEYGVPGSRRHVPFDLAARAIPRSVYGAAVLLAADAAAVFLSLVVLSAAFVSWASRHPMAHALRADDFADAGRDPQVLAPDGFLTLAPIGAMFLAFLLCGHYTRRQPFWREARHVTEAAAVAGILTIELHLPYRNAPPIILTVIAWALLPAVILAARTAARRVMARAGFWQIPVVIVGDSSGIDDALSALSSRALPHFRALEILFIDAWSEDRPMERWDSVLRRSGAERIVLAASLNCRRDWDILHSIVEQRVPFSTFSGLGGLPVSAADPFCIVGHDRVLLDFRNRLAQPSARLVKGIFDFVLSGLLLLLLLPLFAVIATVVSADGGPVFYAQTRVGREGLTFRCLKFRSMSVKADQILREHLASNADAVREWEMYHKLRHDPRVTRVGRLLRATSLDELPQLLNVLRMEMSLVGPRPIIRAEEPRYGNKMNFYCETRPGLTGLWQVSGRSTTSYARRVQLDTWYVSNWSLWLDITIMVKTLLVVLGGRGAY